MVEPIAMESFELAAPEAAAAPQAAAAASMLHLVLAMAVLTALAVGAGGMFGLQVAGKVDKAAPAAADVPQGQNLKSRYPDGANLRALSPIVTNLASPGTAWIRLEASVVLDGDMGAEVNALAASLSDDITAFLRTLALAQLEGPSGYQHLREDLMDRARIRGGAKVRDLVIHTLIVE